MAHTKNPFRYPEHFFTILDKATPNTLIATVHRPTRKSCKSLQHKFSGFRWALSQSMSCPKQSPTQQEHFRKMYQCALTIRTRIIPIADEFSVEFSTGSFSDSIAGKDTPPNFNFKTEGAPYITSPEQQTALAAQAQHKPIEPLLPDHDMPSPEAQLEQFKQDLLDTLHSAVSRKVFTRTYKHFDYPRDPIALLAFAQEQVPGITFSLEVSDTLSELAKFPEYTALATQLP